MRFVSQRIVSNSHIHSILFQTIHNPFCYLATFNKTNIEFDRLSPNAAMFEDRYDWLEKNRPIPINCKQPNISISNMLLIKIVSPQRIEHKFDIPSLDLSTSLNVSPLSLYIGNDISFRQISIDNQK